MDDSLNKEKGLKRKRQFLIKSLQNDDPDSLSESAPSSQTKSYISYNEIKDDQTPTSPLETTDSLCLSVSSNDSNDGSYISSDEERFLKNNSDVLSINYLANETLRNQIYFTKEQKVYYNLPKNVQFLVEAMSCGHPTPYEVPIETKPEWLDTEKFKLGQKFAKKYYFCLSYSEMLTMLMGLMFPGTLDTLIYSGNSGNPFTSYKRHLSTVHRVKSWFEDDIWDKKSTGYKNLRAVRAMHINISKKINSESEESFNERLRIEDALWCPLYKDLKEDFRSLCPIFQCSPESFRDKRIYVNQCEMSLTQFGFFGLILLYPSKFGAGSASKEELDAFVHVWRVLGYYLGIDDKFNFCQGSVEEVKERCKNVIDYWLKSNFSCVSQQWEHMSRCFVEGVSYYVFGVSFEVSLLYLCWVLDIDAPKLYSSLTWGQYLMFNLVKLSMCVLIRIPGVRVLFNLLLEQSVDKAKNRTPEELKCLQKRMRNFKTSKCFKI